MNVSVCFSLAGLLLVSCAADAQVRSAHPPIQKMRPASKAMVALARDPRHTGVRLPFETPASIACIYRLVPQIVPGCPVGVTRDLPSGGSGMIVVVNAYHHPAAQHDLNVFSRQFGLPECNETNPCFQTVYSAGAPPTINPIWSLNIDVIEYAHAFAPTVRLVLVESPSGTFDDLNAAIVFANQFVLEHSPSGTAQMILPWGDFESPDQTSTDALLTTPGIVYIAGNQLGIDLEYPASSPNVIAVGVTGILRDANGVFQGETASTFDTGGVSAFEPRPLYQDVIAGIVGNRRGVPDVALISDPLHGAVLLYDSIDVDGFVGWQYSGNVGIAEAIWAAVIDVAGRGRVSTIAELSAFYQHGGDTRVFRDVTIGHAFGNQAKLGWDVLTGWGVAVGSGAK